MTGFTIDPATLALQTTGLVPAGGSHIRQVLFDQIETRLPRDPESRINIQLSELNPGKTASWHSHNGVVYFVLLRGIITLQYEGTTDHYSAGDVYTEPIGVVHRALNPHSHIPASLVGFWVTAGDRPHIAETGEPNWAPINSTHPTLISGP
jgi:quercetin dioxygenase-like cupin family protein